MKENRFFGQKKTGNIKGAAGAAGGKKNPVKKQAAPKAADQKTGTKKTDPAARTLPVKPQPWNGFYMTSRDCSVMDLLEAYREGCAGLAEQTEIWKEAGILEITVGEKDSLDIEELALFEDEEDRRFLEEKGIRSVFSIETDSRYLDTVKTVFGEVIKKCGGFVCEDTPDFEPVILP